MRLYTFRIKYGFRDDLGFPFRDEIQKTIKAATEDEAYMELDYYCEVNEIQAFDYKLISTATI